ncbi:hypothetical protein [Rugamonas apoptosis]|uniref:Uncharacterized protein n=1 Tax=Rugamonas apoptosis TaxID=2758570 RepID=A0A7W2IJN3_9BURK|nr:hypothetical protein [Rugamonas apoptosis]MBA5686704.1 hypothetical protein [Rugamonas apoptosis]
MEVSENVRLPQSMRMSTQGNNAIHKDNRADRAHVYDWCDKNMPDYLTMDKAAAAVFETREVAAQLKTIRNWMTSWKRERAGKIN